MPIIGIRELRQRTAEVMRRLREEQEEYVITYQGRPVAILIPLPEDQVEAAMMRLGRQVAAAGWEAYEALTEALRQAWPKRARTPDVLDEIRQR